MVDWPDRFYKMDVVTHVVTKVEFEEWCQVHNPEVYSIAWTGNDMQHVSTIFLGLDHNFFGDWPGPVLFETMVFGGKYDEAQWRYCTYEEAIEGHNNVCKMVFQMEGVGNGK